jgi:transcriptional regulator with XRE-family HTH domain
VANLSEAVERDIQQLQVEARRRLVYAPSNTLAQRKRQTWIEARRQRCRQARYERYLAVVELRRQGHTQEEIAERVGLNAETVARWLNAGEFPERQIRSDRRRDQAVFKQKLERGLHPSLARTHYSSARIAALLSKPPKTLSSSQNDHLGLFFGSARKGIDCVGSSFGSEPCCGGERQTSLSRGSMEQPARASSFSEILRVR